jgi:hypothetical protein
MSEDAVTELDKHFCQRITGIRSFFEILIKKLGINFCMMCFREANAVTEVDAVDVLGRPRKITLCKSCLVEWEKHGSGNTVLP